MPWEPRRIVTGHDEQGRSVVMSDGAPPVARRLQEEGVAFFEVWNTNAMPAPIEAVESDPTQRPITIPPRPNGTVIRVNEFLPGHLQPDGRQSPMHRSETVDYGIVLEGEMVLVLDDGVEVELRPGDIVIQRGTDHAWANRSGAVARMAFVLVDGAFADGLRALLPGGGIESGMEGSTAGLQTD
jgi:hypothetical protein